MPMMDYADFRVDSGRMENIESLHNLRKPALKVIDDKSNNGLDDTHLTLKQDDAYIETHRLLIGLRRSNEITFKTKTTKLTKVPNSPCYRAYDYGIEFQKRHKEQPRRLSSNSPSN